MTDDGFNLQRFIDAQEDGGSYQLALEELAAGSKMTHWIWFVFPQIKGLGSSETAQFFALDGLDEARTYLSDPILGSRLTECCRLLLEIDEVDPELVFGQLDAMKLRSSMTLFSAARPGEPLFGLVLEKFFAGVPDEATESAL